MSDMDLNDWLTYDQQRKNKSKKVSRFMNLIQKGVKKEEQLKEALIVSEKFNIVKKSSHRDFSTWVEKIISLINHESVSKE